jgi:hypothetical protein
MIFFDAFRAIDSSLMPVFAIYYASSAFAAIILRHFISSFRFIFFHCASHYQTLSVSYFSFASSLFSMLFFSHAGFRYCFHDDFHIISRFRAVSMPLRQFFHCFFVFISLFIDFQPAVFHSHFLSIAPPAASPQAFDSRQLKLIMFHADCRHADGFR